MLLFKVEAFWLTLISILGFPFNRPLTLRKTKAVDKEQPSAKYCLPKGGGKKNSAEW